MTKKRKVSYIVKRKEKRTANTQVVVVNNLIFLDDATGFAGSFHDVRMLKATKLYENVEANIT